MTMTIAVATISHAVSPLSSVPGSAAAADAGAASARAVSATTPPSRSPIFRMSARPPLPLLHDGAAGPPPASSRRLGAGSVPVVAGGGPGTLRFGRGDGGGDVAVRFGAAGQGPGRPAWRLGRRSTRGAGDL